MPGCVWMLRCRQAGTAAGSQASLPGSVLAGEQLVGWSLPDAVGRAQTHVAGGGMAAPWRLLPDSPLCALKKQFPDIRE